MAKTPAASASNGKRPQREPAPLEAPASAIAEIERLLSSELKASPTARTKVAARIAQIVVSEQFSGPVPHPRHLRDYEAIVPGAADRILRMAEKSTDIEEFVWKADAADAKRGMYCGASLFASLILAAFASLFVTTNPVVPGFFLGTAAIGGIAAFLRKRG